MKNKNAYRIGKTYEELYGLEKALNYKEKLSIAGKKKKYSDEEKEMYKQVQARISKGKTMEQRYGIERAKEIRQKIKDKTKEALSNPKIKAKISAWQTGRKMPREVVEKRAKTMKEKGYKHSKETKEKMSKTAVIQGRKPKITKEIIELVRLKNTGKKRSEEVRAKLRETRAKQIMPIKDTTIEVKIQNFLKQLKIEFYTHQYIKEIEHRYQCDILIPSIKLVIECDGDYWHNYPIGTEIDHIRTSELISKGFIVLRLWENEIRKMEIHQFKTKLDNINNGI